MKLSFGQLWAVLFLFRIFTVMSSGTDYCVNAFLGSLISAAVQFAVIITVIKFTSGIKKPPETWGVFFSIYFIFTGMTAAARLYDLAEYENLAVSPLTVSVLAGVTVLFCSRYGLTACGRASVIISWLFIFFMFILVIMVSGNIKADNISFAYEESGSVISYALRDISEDTMFPLIPVLALFTEKNRAKGAGIYFVSRLILSAVTVFLGSSVIGRISVISDYPFFSICSFSGSAGVQRSDVMFLISSVLAAVLFITVCVCAASFFLSKYLKQAELVSSVLMIAGGFVFSGENTDYALIIMCAVFLAADILFIMQMRKSDKREENAV